MAFGALEKGMGEDVRPVESGKVNTDGKSIPNVEEVKGGIMRMKAAMDEVLQMLGPDTSQDEVFDKMNPAETTGSMKMADSQKNLRRRVIVAQLQKLR